MSRVKFSARIAIGSFMMSYLKLPDDPVWAFNEVNDKPVFNPSASVDFTTTHLSLNALAMMILAHLGINLGVDQVATYAMMKETAGT